MRYLLFLSLSSLFVFGCVGQKNTVNPEKIRLAHEQAITNRLHQYFDLINKDQYRDAFDMVHPGLFEIVPKDMIIGAFEQVVNDTTMHFSFGESKIGDISDIHSHENTLYSKVDYVGEMEMKLLGDVSKEQMDLTISMLKMQFGEDAVSSMPENVCRIKKESTMIAIKDPDKPWMFIENNQEYKGLFDQLIPKEIQEKLQL